MSREALLTWLYDRFQDSLSPAPVTFPQNAVCGIMKNLGFGSTEVTVLKYRPAHTIDVETTAAVILNIPDENETAVTLGGPYGQLKNTVNIELDVMWEADFSGSYSEGIAPTYTDEALANQKFNKLLEAIKQTIRLSVHSKTNADLIEGRNWVLTDPTTNKTSRLTGRQSTLRTVPQSPALAENKLSLFFSAHIYCSYIEVFNEAQI